MTLTERCVHVKLHRSRLFRRDASLFSTWPTYQIVKIALSKTLGRYRSLPRSSRQLRSTQKSTCVQN